MKKPVNRPDSGWSWMVMVASSVVAVIIFGTVKSTGLLYTELTFLYKIDRSAAASITTVCIMVTSVVSTIAGMLCNYISTQKLVFIGGVVACVGFIVCSLAPSILVFMIGFGALYGFGAGFSAIPSKIAVTKYFVKKRTLALGLSMTGSCVGGIIVPPLFEMLIDSYGLKNAMLVMSAVVLHICACGSMFYPLSTKKPRTIQNIVIHTISESVDNGYKYSNSNVVTTKENNITNNKLSLHNSDSNCAATPCPQSQSVKCGLCKAICKEVTVLSNPHFYLISLSSWAGHAAVISINLCLPDYAMTESTDEITRSQAAFMVSCIAIGDLVGRLVMTWISNKQWIQLKHSFIISLFIMSTMLCSFAFVRSYLGLLVFSVAIGIAIGAILLMPTFLFNEYIPSEQWASAYGFASLMMVIPSGIGPLLGNLRETSGSYASSFYLLSGLTMVCCLLWVVESLVTYKQSHGTYHVTKNSLEVVSSSENSELITLSLSCS